MTDDEFRRIHESIITQYSEKIINELRIARERWMATNRRLDITHICCKDNNNNNNDKSTRVLNES